MILELTQTMAGGLPADIIVYRPTRRVHVHAIDICTRTHSCIAQICIAAFGSSAASNGLALATGVTAYAGASILWSGDLPLEPDEEVWAVFTGAVAGDICDLTLKVVAHVGR